MKQLGVVANTTKSRAPDVLRRLVGQARALGLALSADADTVALAPDLRLPVVSGFRGMDAVIALGGDGTMLRTFRALNGDDIPLIGVNIGSLGFLTSVAETEMDRALECLSRDEVRFSRRSVAECRVRDEHGREWHYRGLNDAVVSHGESSRVMALDVSVGGERVAAYVCDGLIVSTPTGSTGHNLSAGGPIVMPEARTFVVSVICPHTLSSRPLVLSDDLEIVIRPGRPGESALRLAVDGQVGQALEGAWTLHIKASPQGVRFIHLPDYSYFRVLSQKLGWKGSAVR